MTPLEKVTKYVNEHVGPFTVKKLTNHYLLGTTSVLVSLRKLENEKKLIRKKVNNKAVWFKPPVAIPTQTTQLPNPPAYQRPIQNSYPTVRGYDD